MRSKVFRFSGFYASPPSGHDPQFFLAVDVKTWIPHVYPVIHGIVPYPERTYSRVKSGGTTTKDFGLLLATAANCQLLWIWRYRRSFHHRPRSKNWWHSIETSRAACSTEQVLTLTARIWICLKIRALTPQWVNWQPNNREILNHCGTMNNHKKY